MIRAAILALLAATAPAFALTQVQLDRVAIEPRQDARLPAGLELLAGDRPAVLVFADFDCQDLCNPIVGQTSALLRDTGLSPTQDFQMVVVGLDAKDEAAEAQVFLDDAVDPAIRPALTLRQPPQAQVDRVADALGYVSVYDPERDAYAHPAAMFVLTAEGGLSRVFPGLMPDPEDLRRALIEAGDGHVGGLVERIALTCFAFDPETGRYNFMIERALTAASLLTALLMAVVIWIALRRERRRTAR